MSSTTQYRRAAPPSPEKFMSSGTLGSSQIEQDVPSDGTLGSSQLPEPEALEPEALAFSSSSHYIPHPEPYLTQTHMPRSYPSSQRYTPIGGYPEMRREPQRASEEVAPTMSTGAGAMQQTPQEGTMRYFPTRGYPEVKRETQRVREDVAPRMSAGQPMMQQEGTVRYFPIRGYPEVKRETQRVSEEMAPAMSTSAGTTQQMQQGTMQQKGQTESAPIIRHYAPHRAYTTTRTTARPFVEQYQEMTKASMTSSITQSTQSGTAAAATTVTPPTTSQTFASAPSVTSGTAATASRQGTDYPLKVAKRYKVIGHERVELPLKEDEIGAMMRTRRTSTATTSLPPAPVPLQTTEQRLTDTYRTSKPMSFQRPAAATSRVSFQQRPQPSTTQFYSPDEMVERSESRQFIPKEQAQEIYAAPTFIQPTSTTTTTSIPPGYTDTHLEEEQRRLHKDIAQKRHLEREQIQSYERQLDENRRRDVSLSENESIEEAHIPGVGIREKVIVHPETSQFIRTMSPFHSEFISPGDFPILPPVRPKPLMLTYEGETRLTVSIRDPVKDHPHIQTSDWVFSVVTWFPISGKNAFVQRTVRQFKHLREELILNYPGALVPPLPEMMLTWKKAGESLGISGGGAQDVSITEIATTRMLLQLFVDHVSRNPVLAGSREFLRFLSFPYNEYLDYTRRRAEVTKAAKIPPRIQLYYLNDDYNHMDQIRLHLEEMRDAFSDLLRFHRDSMYSLVRVHESANTMNRFEDQRSGINPLLQNIRAAAKANADVTSHLVHNLQQQRDTLSFYARWSHKNMETIYRFDQLLAQREVALINHQQALSAAQYYYNRRGKYPDRFRDAEFQEKSYAAEVDALYMACDQAKHAYGHDLTQFHVSRRTDLQELLSNFIVVQYESSSTIHNTWRSVYENTMVDEDGEAQVSVFGHHLVEERIGEGVVDPGEPMDLLERRMRRRAARERILPQRNVREGSSLSGRASEGGRVIMRRVEGGSLGSSGGAGSIRSSSRAASVGA